MMGWLHKSVNACVMVTCSIPPFRVQLAIDSGDESCFGALWNYADMYPCL
jgi:hypothetical protein